MTRRILVVEDDQVTQDVVSNVLAAHGYLVDSVGDGHSAVERLCALDYDLALIDYHLPELDGYASARLASTLAGPKGGPKLVAMTANPRALARRPLVDQLFDAVLAKPFAPQALCTLVERLLQDPRESRARLAAGASWRERGLDGRPKALAAPPASASAAFALREAFDLVADVAEADVILLLSADGVADVAALRGRGAHLLPVADLSGERARETDVAFRLADLETWTELAAVLVDFRRRAGELNGEAREARNASARILAHMFVADRAMSPVLDVRDRHFFTFAGAAFDGDPVPEAEMLACEGYLSKTFSDRFTVCGACDSHRLTAREECRACRSPSLERTSLLRHFRCGTVTPEADCRRGAGLECPACKRAMRAPGEDFARFGPVKRCRDCGATEAEPAIGFVCVDCGAHTDAKHAKTVDVSEYALTRRAIRYLTATVPDAAGAA